MAERIILRTGEALVAGGPPGTAAEPEVVIGALDGPVGTAMATLMGGQVKGHTRVFALLNTDVQVRPATLMVSKVTVGGAKATKYTNILMGTVQAAIAHGVLDAVRVGDLPKSQVNELGIICAVWLAPGDRRRRRSRPPRPVRHSPAGHGQGDRARRCVTSRRSTGCSRTRTRSSTGTSRWGWRGRSRLRGRPPSGAGTPGGPAGGGAGPRRLGEATSGATPGHASVGAAP